MANPLPLPLCSLFTLRIFESRDPTDNLATSTFRGEREKRGEEETCIRIYTRHLKRLNRATRYGVTGFFMVLLAN